MYQRIKYQRIFSFKTSIYLFRWLNGGELAFYYPFGGGPRICIGLRFAIMETKMILVRLLKTFELKRCLETEVKINKILKLIFLRIF